MYESPVNLIFRDVEQIIRKQEQQREQIILDTIKNCGVVVDKEELIKALQYDRNQYAEGYEDGKNDVLEKIRAEIENHCGLVKENHCRFCSYCSSVMGVREILEVIDKYKAENEE